MAYVPLPFYFIVAILDGRRVYTPEVQVLTHIHCLYCRRYLGNIGYWVYATGGFYCSHCKGHTYTYREGNEIKQEFRPKRYNVGQRSIKAA